MLGDQMVSYKQHVHKSIIYREKKTSLRLLVLLLVRKCKMINEDVCTNSEVILIENCKAAHAFMMVWQRT